MTKKHSRLIQFVAGGLVLIGIVGMADMLLAARCQIISDKIALPAIYAAGSCYVKYPTGVVLTLF